MGTGYREPGVRYREVDAPYRGVFVFTTPLEVPASMHASLREATPNTPDTPSQVLRLDGSPGASIVTLLDLDIPAEISVDAEILHAELILFRSDAWTAGVKTITVHALSGWWDPRATTFATIPAVGTTFDAETTTGDGAAGDQVSINVTELAREAVAARDAGVDAFFGFRLTTSSTDELSFFSSLATPQYGPFLRLEVSVPPFPPEDLVPAGGRAVSMSKPVLSSRFRDSDAEDTISAIHVQVSTDDTFTTVDYDSGEVAATSTLFDLGDPPTGAPAATDLVEGETNHWRVRVRDNHGLWSEWSAPVSFVYIDKGVLTVTEPAGSTTPSPTPSFEFTFAPAGAETQELVEVELEQLIDGLWRSRWVYRTTDAVTSVTLPDDYALEEGERYRRAVRLFDSIEREDIAGDRAFLEDIAELTLEPLEI